MYYRQGAIRGKVSPGELFIAQKGKDQRFETGDAGFLHKRSILVQGIGLDALMQATGLNGLDRVSFENPACITNLFRRCYRLLREKPTGFASELFLKKSRLRVPTQAVESCAQIPIKDALELSHVELSEYVFHCEFMMSNQ